ncbi:hypothetical protein HID58_003133 [Brassica napus]|uniref:(rape) hypothetical protein n=1 Tax=Brassica napus TaxID=3708 RepID=A0A816W5T6_BRANA|nr:jacalin-related lectin 24-like [Brassica napus]XP_048612722.1 jacalin-related lectin 24-like [Brassica napus]KAH0878117.1 hypothetical protein HID58_065511 [Brassica napus]KAH0943496.1 hypothetical protein HID58_003133 [Brassica napus]CAF2129257.1 unnamed protein product [Brassica napus]
MISASSRVMISAGSVGTRATYDEPYDSDGEETADTEWDEKGRNIISHIYVSYRNFITSIQFGYLNSEEDEALTLSTKFGPSEGHSFRAVILKQDEYVTGLSGVHGYGMRDGIKSLTFHTNCGEHGPIGSVNDNSAIGFKIDIDPGIRDRREFGGFFGSYSKNNLSSVGIYVSPIARYDMVAKRENIGPSKTL